MLGNKATGSPAPLRWGPGGAGAAWSPCPSLLVPCLPPCSPASPAKASLLRPRLQVPGLGSLLPSWVGVEREQGSLPVWGQRAAGFPQEHHNQPQQHLAGKPHWLFSTQTNTLEVDCLRHACASTLLASGEAAGPEGGPSTQLLYGLKQATQPLWASPAPSVCDGSQDAVNVEQSLPRN